MDLCFNRDQADEAEIKAEVKVALQMFEHSRNASPLQTRFLNSLSDVLRKHKVQLSEPSILATNNSTDFSHEMMLDNFNNPPDEDQMQLTQLELNMQDPDISLNTSFDEFWQIAVQGDAHPDSLTWDNLFSALDSERPF